MIYQAHKGVSSEYPENTMPAVIAAVEQGYGIIELDIGVTKDLKFVLLHDDYINRTGRYPNGEEIVEKVAVGDLTYEELQGYDFGIRNGEKFKGTKTPLFEDVLKYAQSVKIPIKIDNKYEKMNEEQKKAFFELLAPYTDVACLTCQSIDAIKEALTYFPEMCFHYDGVVSKEHLEAVSQLVPKERLIVWLAHQNEHTYWVTVPYADRELADLVKQYGRLGVWILSTEEHLEDAKALGADIIETNGQLKPHKKKTMKAAVFYGKNDLRIENIEKPTAKAGEVLIRVMACGICGTDIHIFHGDEGAAPTPAGTVLGHEFAGIVEAVGDGVTDIAVGDRVCVDPNKLCNECYYCKSGIGHFCENMIGIGTTVNGGFAEYCVVPKSQVYKIADTTTYEMAAMTEPVACCVHGIDMCDISCGDTVAIIGGGMIGMIMLQLAKLSGAGKLIMIEPVSEKRKMAKRLGADICIDPMSENTKAVLAENHIDRISTVIECVGKTATIRQAIEIAGNKSTVMMFGLTAPGDILEIKPFEIFKKEIVLKASYINPYTQTRALELIDSGKIDVSSMIYAVESLERLPEILSDRALRSKGKFIINPQI